MKKTHGVAFLGIGALLTLAAACGSSTPSDPAPTPSGNAPAPAAAGHGGEGAAAPYVSAGTGALFAHSGCVFQSKPFPINSSTVTVRYSYAGTGTAQPDFSVYLSQGSKHWVAADRVVHETGVAHSYHVVRSKLAVGRYNVAVVSNAKTCTVTVFPGGTPGK